jgi:uncharacterized protein
MKYLLVLAVVAVAFYVWRNNRRIERQEREAAAPPPRPAARGPGQPMAMVACRACGTHLPQTEAITGREGSYCSAEHRQRIEGPSA